jgi:RNA ligase (TIGR02306 family)
MIMSTFSCPVVRVAEVAEHPNADRLNLVRLEGLGYTCISAKMADGSPRYKAGDCVVYIPSASVLPEWLLKQMGFWNSETGKGTLAGSMGDRVKPLNLRGIFSEGVLYPAQEGWPLPKPVMVMRETAMHWFAMGEDASAVLGITKYEPPIPVHMAGEVANLFGYTIKYDFERIESVPDIFEPGMQVMAHEKLHGTFMAIVYAPELHHTEMFGAQGDILVHSKGLGAQGLVFKNNHANDGNLYVRMLRKLLNEGLEDRFKMLASTHGGTTYAILGEVYGAGVQDLNYGTREPEFRMFDVMVDNRFLPQDELGFDSSLTGIQTVPVLYNGEFDLDKLTQVRDGVTQLGGGHVREGIVVRAVSADPHPVHGRRIAKMISPDYLLRKNKNATEYQ